MKQVRLLGYPCGMGAGNHSCKDGPKILKENHLERLFGGFDLCAKWTPFDRSLDSPHANEEERLHYITQQCATLAQNVETSIQEDHFPIIFGGDHSMAIGTWSGVTHALNAQGEFGLLWLDAHMDAHTPLTSETGNIHGMPLAVLLGKGRKRLVDLFDATPKLNPKHVVMIGIRSYEQGEYELLKQAGVRIFFIEEVKERGFAAVYRDALSIVTKARKGFGISFDIDAFDAELVPGTGTKEYNGLRRKEVWPAMQGVAYHPKLKAIEIAEYNPALDDKDTTYHLIEDMLKAFFTR